MFKKLALISLWFLLTPSLLVTCALLLSKHNRPVSNSQTSSNYQRPNHVDGQVLGVEITDMRPYYVQNLLNNRTLEPYAVLMVEVADKYGIDYRLIPAIAMKESGGGNKAPKGTFNAWGFENGKTVFSSWEQAIETVGKTLKERYIAKGMVTPEQIMPVYAPPQVLTGGKWARDINYFFSKMENLSN